jgi:hypothetical protein
MLSFRYGKKITQITSIYLVVAVQKGIQLARRIGEILFNPTWSVNVDVS